MTRSPFRMTKSALPAALALVASLAFGAPVFLPAEQPFGDVPPLALTGFNLSTGTQNAFQGWFDPYSWSGDLSAFPVDTNGRTNLAAKLWSAQALFAGKQACYAGDPGSLTYYDTDRVIITLNGGIKKPFRWNNLSGAQQASIGDATNGPKILNYIRGDRSNEIYQAVLAGDGSVVSECGVKAPATGLFRSRNSILGDLIHSKPLFVGAQPADYLFDDYQAFKSANAGRAARVFVGANDGMMHAFDAATGEEVWAYVPSMVIGNLSKLSVDPYAHEYFVDGGAAAGDANVGSAGSPDWRSVIVGGLGAGGKGLYALDVTDANASNENSAKNKILWEITPSSSGFSDLGYTYGAPVIARLNTGQWAAIVGNGYVNAGTGHAVLYIIDIGTGALIKALDTGSGTGASPNGLSSPIAVDINFDGKTDRIYAGDIDGNLWKFDVSGATAASWTAPASPLHATGKAIIGAPDVVGHPLSGFLVSVATGRLFTAADAADSTVQNYAYGIWDGAPVANDTLLEQTLTETNYATQRVLVSSGLPINWNDATDTATNPLNFGWRTALPPGQRVIGTGFVRDARFHFTSVDPTSTVTPPTRPPNGDNWLNELDYETGGARNKLIFDLNADSLLNDVDRVVDGSNVPIAGPAGIPVSVYMGAGLVSQPVLGILSASLSTTLFNNNPYTSPGDQPSDPPGLDVDPGVSGGHFDVDIYYGGTNDHTHEYDDTYNFTGVNFLNASDPDKNVSNAITNTTTRFKILITNQRLSPAVNFSYGGLPYANVSTLQTTAGLTMASLPGFSRADIGTLKFNMPKNAFTSQDWGTGEVRTGLHPTATNCVKDKLPDAGTVGPNGEYRNGALVFQLVKENTPDSAVQLSDPGGDPRYGYRLKDDAASQSYRLAEWSAFWHHQNKLCMGDAGWTQTPQLDTDPSGAKGKMPAAGSEDPPRDEFGTVVSNITSTEPNPDCSGCTIRTTVTNYSTGVQIIAKEYIDAKGKTKSVTIEIVAPPPGGGGSAVGAPNIGQSVSSPNTLTGYQQTRNTGKLGRVTWHELFKQ